MFSVPSTLIVSYAGRAGAAAGFSLWLHANDMSIANETANNAQVMRFIVSSVRLDASRRKMCRAGLTVRVRRLFGTHAGAAYHVTPFFEIAAYDRSRLIGRVADDFGPFVLEPREHVR